jgi:CheY-like chemotaxis protein
MDVVVLVDDSPNDATFVDRAVEGREPPVELRVFSRGADALAHLADRGEEVGLVLLDLKLPGINGLRILGDIRRHTGRAALPVVIFTSSTEPRDIEEAYAAGANSYVVKPVPFEDFIALVQVVLRYWLEVSRTVPRKGEERSA